MDEADIKNRTGYGKIKMYMKDAGYKQDESARKFTCHE